MEILLHYVWKHKMLPIRPLATTRGEAVEVIDPGLHNHGAGPDFFNAKLRVGGTMWIGNVEIHDKASDWFVHGHDKDKAYDGVVMHIVGQDDAVAVTTEGRAVPQMVLEVPPEVAANYRELLSTDHYPPCYAVIPRLDSMATHGWLSCLLTERLEQKTAAIRQRAELSGGDWEAALFITMSRNYGFGVNGDAFEAWARNVPLHSAAHHRDSLLQTEALFMGQAGLLDPLSVPARYRDDALRDDYFIKLSTEYRFLAHKFGLKPIDNVMWRFLRLRPQNFPHIRISQLANLYHARRCDLSHLRECASPEQLHAVLQTHVTPYWETHYAFGSESRRSRKALSPSSLNLLVVNTVVPVLFAYGRYRRDDALCSRAFDLMSLLPAENNHIVRLWQECGLTADSAADTQALIQLKREYCDKRDCLRCRIGYRYLKSSPHPASLRGVGG